jgi:CheY-like chemotaxis protein
MTHATGHPARAARDDERVVRILLVEDNPADVRLTREALAAAGITNRVDAVLDGEAALAFLRQEAPYADARRPSLILLDLNLPRKDGREVLAVVKADPDLLDIPVVVLTTSSAESDIDASYRHHANCYLTKPDRFADLVVVFSAVKLFWLDLVSLPHR